MSIFSLVSYAPDEQHHAACASHGGDLRGARGEGPHAPARARAVRPARRPCSALAGRSRAGAWRPADDAQAAAHAKALAERDALGGQSASARPTVAPGLKPSARAADQQCMIDVKQALHELVDKGGSDLHLKVGAAPLFRVNGELAGSEGAEPLTAAGHRRRAQTAAHRRLQARRIRQGARGRLLLRTARRRALPHQRLSAARRDLDGLPRDPAQDQHDRRAVAAARSSPNWPTRSAASCCSPARPARESRRRSRR